MSVKCRKEVQVKEEKIYLPHKIRSRPFRCIILPIFCLFLFICYWFVMCPLIYVYFLNHYKQYYKNEWPKIWPYYFWIVALIVFLIILSILICLWCCSPKRKTSEEVRRRQKEYDCLLNDVIEYNTLKCNDLKYEMIELKESSKDLKENSTTLNDSSDNSKDVDCATISKETLDNDNAKHLEEMPLEIVVPKQPEKNSNGESMLKEIDKLFPRCSIRRKVDDKKRPDTLILHSPHAVSTIKEADINRHTLTDVHTSPLTPREIFFYDFIQNANKHIITKTCNFLENERRHSSNNFVNLRKPEIKDFLLKQRSNTEASSPEYFIANVPSRHSCTTEAFLFVDGGSMENELKICYIEDDDDVFKRLFVICATYCLTKLYLIDDCCLLPNQVQIQSIQQQNNRVVLASPQLSQQMLPLQLEFQNEPECLASSFDSNSGQTVDSIRHIFLGRTPRVIKQCVRCGGSAGTVPVTRTAAIRAWDQRWLKSCQCGGLWRMQIYS